MSESKLRRLWDRLPRAARRDIYARVTGLCLPHVRPRAAPLKPPFTVVGALRAPSGLGQAARLAVHALRRSGVTCHAVDLTRTLLQPSTEAPIGVPPPGAGGGTLLFYVTPPNAAIALRAVPRHIRRDKTLVAAWVCETTRLPRLWKRQAQYFHLLTAPTRFAGTTLAEMTGRPVRLLGHPVEAEPLPPPSHAKTAKHLILGSMLDVGSSASRKNVTGLVETLLQILASSENINIRLKIRDLAIDPTAAAAVARLQQMAANRIELIRADGTREAAIRFFDGLDVFLSLSRAEGFALPYAEAILRGVVVAAPRWSGPAEFLDDDNSIPLPYSLVPIRDPSDLYESDMGLWADVNPEAAAVAVLSWLSQLPNNRPLALPPLASTAFFMDCLLGSEII